MPKSIVLRLYAHFPIQNDWSNIMQWVFLYEPVSFRDETWLWKLYLAVLLERNPIVIVNILESSHSYLITKHLMSIHPDQQFHDLINAYKYII